MGVFSGMLRTMTSSVRRLVEKASVAGVQAGSGDPERVEVRARIRSLIQSERVNVGYLDPAELDAQVTELIRLRREEGAEAYERALIGIHEWGVGVVVRGSQERDWRDVVRGVAKTVVPALVGGLVGGAVARAVVPPALGGTEGRAVERARAAVPPAPRKIPFELYAALVQAGDPRAGQFVARGLVAPRATLAQAPTAARRPAAQPVPQAYRQPVAVRRAAAPPWPGVNPAWFGAI